MVQLNEITSVDFPQLCHAVVDQIIYGKLISVDNECCKEISQDVLSSLIPEVTELFMSAVKYSKREEDV